MQRGLIRRRWQITIPAHIRRDLNLFIGQTLNWEIDQEHGIMRLFTGAGPGPGVEQLAFAEAMARRERKQKCRTKIRKSDGNKALRELSEKAKKWRQLSTATELQETLSLISQYLLGIQERLKRSLEGYTE